ncbi:MAG: Electron transfer flavoprotein subunit alpha [Syntrophaceae bacterium PtaU1.Bin231]|nr:MAG: Electron transfer flavoprotein subunit alpha [Syntrophaceae bacterium PtaU1.Bin231]
MILVYSEDPIRTRELITAARTLDKEVAVLAAGNPEKAQALALTGVRVDLIEADLPLFDTGAMATVVALVAEAAGADTVLLASNRRGRELAGRLAQKMGAGCLTDAHSLELSGGELRAVRNTLGGATEATQAVTSARKVVTVSPKAYAPAEAGEGGSVRPLTVSMPPNRVNVRESRRREKDNIDIEAAEVIVAVGQGLPDKAALALADEVAGRLGGVLACSKPVATDRKWLSEERVIGLSGKICSPELALVMGISGQVQFTVGIRDAKTIVAVNTDENAPMCGMSDYILVSDLKETLRQLKDAAEKGL